MICRENPEKIPVWQNWPKCNNFYLLCFVLSCFLVRGVVRNGNPKVSFYSCSTERNSELFFLLRKGSRHGIPRVASFLVPWNGIPSCFLFCGRVQNWILRVFYSLFYSSFLTLLVCFGGMYAAMRCAHPSFWTNEHAKRGAVCPPAHRSFAGPIWATLHPKSYAASSELS
jgi:hypothetical protein